jgi:prolyl-tRNA synthetase
MTRLKKAGIRVKIDDSDQSPGWKFAEYEMKGIPLRLEIGPKDIENDQCVAVRRDNGEKTFVALGALEQRIPELLDGVQAGLYEKAKKNLTENTRPAHSLEEAKAILAEKGGFIKHNVVRRAGVRAENERGGRRFVPLYTLRAGAPGTVLRRLRQNCRPHGDLGRRILKSCASTYDF